MGEVGPLEYFICGGVGGVCLVLVGHPLDTIKVQIQTMPSPKPGEKPMYTGMMDCFHKIIKSEGVPGLYKGMIVPLILFAPILSIRFSGYGLGRRLFGPPPGQQMTHTHYFLAGACAGTCTSPIVAPGERIKCLLQVEHGAGSDRLYDGPVDCAKKLYKQGGISSIYRGVVPTFLRDIPATAMYFLAYETLKNIFTNNGKERPTVPGTLIAGGSAGMAYWLMGMPADVLKSRLQASPEGTYPNGMRDAFAQLIKTDGPLGLYKGITPVLLRAFPANSACFVGFELCHRLLNYVFPKS